MLCLFVIWWNRQTLPPLRQKRKFPVRKRLLIACSKYGLGLGLLAYVIWRNWAPASGQGLQGFWQRHFVEGQPIHTEFLVLAIAIYLTGVLLTFVRWFILV